MYVLLSISVIIVYNSKLICLCLVVWQKSLTDAGFQSPEVNYHGSVSVSDVF